MSITVREIRRSRSFSSGENATREYIAWGSNDGGAIEDAVKNGVGATAGSDQAPSTIGSMYLFRYASAPFDEDESKHAITVEYGFRERSQVGDEVVTFDISPQKSHITHSNHTTIYDPSGGTATDHKGAIGVEEDKLVGTDVYVPSLSYTVKRTEYASSITTSYVQGLASAAFTYNNATFRGAAVGECLYMGASGSPNGSNLYDVSHKFLVSPNIVGRTIGDITGISKLGWEYLWVQYQEDEDDVAKAIAKIAVGAYVERVYGSSNLSAATGVSAS